MDDVETAHLFPTVPGPPAFSVHLHHPLPNKPGQDRKGEQRAGSLACRMGLPLPRDCMVSDGAVGGMMAAL